MTTATTDLGQTFFVEAGAGAGKTHALVERVIALVAAGTPITAIAAITFTEAAAAELRDRVRDRLEELAELGSSAAGGLASAALEEIDDAPLLTLHAFAHRILSAHAMAAGLPAVIEVRDEVEAAIAFDHEWDVLFDSLVSDVGLVDTLGACLVLGLNEGHLRSLARIFDASWDALVDQPFSTTDLHGGHGPTVDLSRLRELLAPLRAAIAGCSDDDDRLCLHLHDTVLPFEERLTAAAMEAPASMLAVLDVLRDGDIRGSNRGKAGNWRNPAKSEVVSMLEAATAECQLQLDRVRGELLARAAEELRRFTLERVGRRRAAGALEFHDLLVMVRDLLVAQPDVLTAARRAFAHLLIDEFQDTDPLQAELALLLATGDPAGARPGLASAAAADPGRLFFVGDPKQSIYRFRRADMPTYLRMRYEFARHVVALPTNYRSTRELIAWINAVFGALFGNVDGQAPWRELVAVRRGRADMGPPVVTFGGAAPQGDTVGMLREREADELVGLIQRAVGDPWSVAQETGDGWRPARLDDIAILLPTRTSLPTIERALDRAGIPSRIESRSLVWSTQEVRELLAILRAIDDPSDEVAVVAALRSAALACSDRDLLDAVTAGFRFDRMAASMLDDASPVRAALRRLDALRGERWSISFTALVERVVRDMGLLELGLASPRRREAWNRVRFVVDQARAFADAGRGATLRSFLDWAERQADEKARAMETVVPERDHIAVRITTIHAAKGREFPIVVVAGLSVEGEPFQTASVMWGEGGAAPELRLGRGELRWMTPGWDNARLSDLVLDRLEEDRLLYVACTRARDHLCVSLHQRAPSGQRTSMAARLSGAVDATGRRADASALPLVLALGPVVSSSVREGAASERPSRSIDVVDAWAFERDAFLASVPSAFGGSSRRTTGRSTESDLVGDGERDGRAVGTAVHAVLRRVRLDGDGSDIEALVRTVWPDDEGDVIARMARSVWASPSVREAATAARRWREFYVGRVLTSGVLVEGYIDLLYERDGGLVIVDYKTDAATGNDVAALIDVYRPQLLGYAEALRSIAPTLPVVEAVLVVARATSDAVELVIDGDDLHEAP